MSVLPYSALFTETQATFTYLGSPLTYLTGQDFRRYILSDVSNKA